MTAVTGVSGSGKSTLVTPFLKALAQKLNHNSDKPGKYKSISGYEKIERLIDIDQSQSRTPRSIRRIPQFLMIFEIYSPIPMKPRFVVIKKVVLL
jgi:excinuclease UvrABC ATPase subunit